MMLNKLRRFLLSAALLCAVTGAAAAATLTVTKTDDTDDGICDNDCSLREAIALASVAGDTIVFASPTFDAPQIITLSDAVNFRELLINKNLTIIGKGANLLTIRRSPTAAAQFRIFNIPTGTVSISGLTITGGNSSVTGGGIYSTTNLTLSGVHVTGNTTSSFGGGISAGNSASGNFSTLTITNSTVSNNTATGSSSGGGIDTAGDTTITDSTITGNRGGRAGGIDSGVGTLTIINSTITRNSTTSGGLAGGVYRSSTGTTRNSIIAANCAFDAADPACNNASTPDVSGGFNSGGYNIVGGANFGSGFTNGVNGDQVGTVNNRVNPQLYPLRDNGGQVPTHALRSNSPAINPATSNNAPTTDQRGAPRLGNADTGAFEFLPMVTNTNDAGAGSLRQTVADVPTGGFVIFEDDFFRNQAREITLTSAQIDVGKNLTIVGTGANLLTVRRNPQATSQFRIFDSRTSTTVGISGVTITGGDVSGVGGGGILLVGTNMTISGVHITGNSASVGGGISCSSGGRLTVLNSTISNNTAIGSIGGAIESSGSVIVILGSTISGNRVLSGSSSSVGGIFSQTSDLSIINSTITRNSVPSGGGAAGGVFYGNSNPATIRNSIIAANCDFNAADPACNYSTVPDVSAGNNAPFGSQGYNLIGAANAGSGFTDGVNGDQVGTVNARRDPLLAALADNGGATPTHSLLGRSPAIDAGNCFGCSLDQRGSPRPFDLNVYANAPGGDGSDIGRNRSDRRRRHARRATDRAVRQRIEQRRRATDRLRRYFARGAQRFLWLLHFP